MNQISPLQQGYSVGNKGILGSPTGSSSSTTALSSPIVHFMGQDNQQQQQQQQHQQLQPPNKLAEQLDWNRQRLRDIPTPYQNYALLKMLYVNDNLLTTIPPEFILATPNLTIADFSYNKLSGIPNELDQWQMMHTLRLDRNTITELPDSIVLMKALEVLGLSSNLLVDIPNLTKLPRLKTLTLYQNNLPSYIVKIYGHVYSNSTSSGGSGSSHGGSSSVHNSLLSNIYNSSMEQQQRPTTTSIIVNNPSTSSTPDELSSAVNSRLNQPSSIIPTSKLPMQYLSINVSPIASPHSAGSPSHSTKTSTHRLDLSGTNFICFPFSVDQHSQLTKLHRLNLGHNHKIDFDQCLPYWTSFKSLKVLNLDHCQLNSIPISICNIVTLRRLNVKKNYINNIPVEIQNLHKLKRLDLSHNIIDKIPNEIAMLGNLKSINLNNNKLKSYSGIDYLSQIGSLTKINLNHNHLKEFPKSLLSLKLNTLYLDHNEIKCTPSEIKNVPTLTEFSINNNRLTSAPSSPYFQSISFVNNPIIPPIPALPLETCNIPSSLSIPENLPILPLSPTRGMDCLELSNGDSPTPTYMSPQTPTSPLSLAKKPPKPLPVIPHSKSRQSLSALNSQQPVGASNSSSNLLSQSTSLVQIKSISVDNNLDKSSGKPKVPPLKLKSNSNNNNSGNGEEGKSSGLIPRVRSFTSYDYKSAFSSPPNSASVKESSELSQSHYEGSSFLEGHLLRHTTSSSSSNGSWPGEEEVIQVISPEYGEPKNGSQSQRNRVISPISTPHTLLPQTDRSKEKKSFSKMSEFFHLAKESIHFRKKSSSSSKLIDQNGAPVSNSIGGSNGTSTPRGNGSPQLLKEDHSSPSTPRPLFPERNGSSSSLTKDNNSNIDSPTPRIRDQIQLNNGKKIIYEESIAMAFEDTSNPQMLKTRTLSESNLEYNPISQSLPSGGSLLADTMAREEQDAIYSTSIVPGKPMGGIFIKSPPMEGIKPTYSDNVNNSNNSLYNNSNNSKLKLEFVEEIYDEKNNPISFWKKRLSGMVMPAPKQPNPVVNTNRKSTISSAPQQLPVNKAKKKAEMLNSLNESKGISTNIFSIEKVPSASMLNNNNSSGNLSTSRDPMEPGSLKESTSSTSLGQNNAYVNLDGDEFIRDLMASPIINQELEFTSEDGVPKIKTASLKMLVSLLTHERGQSRELENGFFDTYTLFTNVDVIINQLTDRFLVTGKNNSPIIKHKVLRFVQRWVDRNWEDFSSKQVERLLEFCKSCQETVEQGMTTTYTLKNQITILSNTIEMKRDGHYVQDENDDMLWDQTAAPPIPDFTFQENFTIIDLKSHEVARQMVMIDHALLAKITKKELLDYVQSQSNPPQSIVNVTNRFNYVSRWVASEITTCPTLEKRIVLIFKFINIALNCWNLKNFNSATAIIAGMKHGAVCRLKTTWFHVNNTKVAQIFQEFEEMISPTSIAKFRKIMDNVDPPSVPYLGSYFHHLVGITEGNKSINSNDQINLVKYEMIGKILSRVHLFQSKTYNLTSVGVLQTFLNNGLQLTEDQLYEAVEAKKEERIDKEAAGEGSNMKFGLFNKNRFK